MKRLWRWVSGLYIILSANCVCGVGLLFFRLFIEEWDKLIINGWLAEVEHQIIPVWLILNILAITVYLVYKGVRRIADVK